MSKNDLQTLKIMLVSVLVEASQYTLAIPWKVDPKSLPNNRTIAETRLRHLTKKLGNDEMIHNQYTTTVEKYIGDGHARRLTAKELEDTGGQWYLPHHPVFKKSNLSKCRVVFDFAATYRAPASTTRSYKARI